MLPVLAKPYIMTIDTYNTMQLCGEAAARGIALNHTPTPPGWCEGTGRVEVRRRSRTREQQREAQIKCRPTFPPHDHNHNHNPGRFRYS